LPPSALLNRNPFGGFQMGIHARLVPLLQFEGEFLKYIIYFTSPSFSRKGITGQITHSNYLAR